MKTPIKHQYPLPKLMRFSDALFNFFGLIFPILIIVLPSINSFIKREPVTLESLLGVIGLGLFGSLVFLVRGNFYTEIISDAQGLQITFLWRQIKIPWKDVIEVRPSYLNFPRIKTYWIIRTRKLTPFHRVYGLLYSLTYRPCVVYHSGISESEELRKRIKSAMRKKRKGQL